MGYMHLTEPACLFSFPSCCYLVSLSCFSERIFLTVVIVFYFFYLKGLVYFLSMISVYLVGVSLTQKLTMPSSMFMVGLDNGAGQRISWMTCSVQLCVFVLFSLI